MALSLDPRRILGIPIVYQAFQGLIGAERMRSVYAAECLKVGPGMRVLDIGCGTADILRFICPAEYVGFDPSPAYIAANRRRFGTDRLFAVGSAEDPPEAARGQFDLVMANAVLHHIDDLTAGSMFSYARSKLAEGGRLVTLDGAYTPDQSKIARFIISKDRGKHVRTPEEYEVLAAAKFSSVSSEIRNDLMRIPYTLFMMTCKA